MSKRSSVSYDRLDSLASSSSNQEISHLSQIVQNLKARLEALEKTQTEMLDEINSLKRGEKSASHNRAHAKVSKPKEKGRRNVAKYACTMCDAKFANPKTLQRHRKEAHKAAYNI